MNFAVDVCIKTTLLLVFAGLLSSLLARASAAIRHAVWGSVLVALLAFPLVWTFIPVVNVEILPEKSSTPAVRSMPDGVLSVSESVSTASYIAAAAPTVETAASSNWTPWVALGWALGFCVVMLQGVAGFWGLRRLITTSRQLHGDPWSGLLAEAREHFSISRDVELRTAANPSPLTCGILRHSILLPASASEWSVTRQRLVLAHEMAHVKRNDGLGQLLCLIVCAVYWFNPLVWYAVRRLRIERERACDDHVLRLGASAPDYANHLIQIARGLNARLAPTAVSMAQPSQLKSRVVAILDSRIRREGMSNITAMLLLIATAALTLSLGSIHITTLSAMPLPALPAPMRAPTPVAKPAPVSKPKPVQEPSPGYVVNRPPISYPAEAIRKHIEGSVVVELTFNARGEIVDSRVLSGPEELRQAALQTALQGKYGISVARSLQVIVDFTLPAQGTAELSGTVSDSSRVPLPGVVVSATNSQTGVTSTIFTNASGSYRFQDLPAATYRLSARMDGFKSASYENVAIGSPQQIRMNFALQPNTGPISTWVVPPTSPASVPKQLNPGVLGNVIITGLPPAFSPEIREKIKDFHGRMITGDLLDQIRSSIRESSWGDRPVALVVSSTGTETSDLMIKFEVPSNPSTPAMIRVGAYLIAANLIHQVKPVYPQEAKDAKIQGVVVLEINIGRDGRVIATRMITGHPLLVQPAMDAVRQWIYKPIMLNGEPVDTVSTVTVNFALRD